MAPRGTKPHPHALRKLSRAAGDRAHTKRLSTKKGRATVPEEKAMPAKPLVHINNVPASLASDMVAATFYKKTLKMLKASKVLSVNDIEGVESFALAYSRALEAEQHVTTNGVVLRDITGWKANPAVAVARAQWQEFRRWACEFGMTPSSRTRIAQLSALPGQGDGDDSVANERGEAQSTEDFLFGKKGRVVGAIGA